LTITIERLGVMGPIRLAIDNLANPANQHPILIQIYGPSGVGKTVALRSVARECRANGFTTIELDLQILELQTPSGFASAVLTALLGRPSEELGLNGLLSRIKEAVADLPQPLVISIDSLDHGSGAIQAIDKVLSVATPRVLVVTADAEARKYLAQDRVTDVRVVVDNFTTEDIYRLITEMQDAGRLAGVVSARDLASKLLRGLAGRPVLVRLALEAEDRGLIEFDRLSAVSQATVPRRVLANLITSYPVAGRIWEVLRLVSAPLGPDFLSELIGEPSAEITKGLDLGSGLGAIRDCGNGTYLLHDEVARQLRSMGDSGSDWLRQRATDLVGHGRDWSLVERLFVSTLADDEGLVGSVLDRLQTSLRAGHGTEARLAVETSGVLADAIDNLACSQRLRAGARIAMSYACTRDYNSVGALQNLDAVSDLAKSLPDMRPRWLLARAHATLSPARFGQTLQSGTEAASDAAGLFEAQSDVPQHIAALVTYARGLNLQGRHSEAGKTLSLVLEMTGGSTDDVLLTLRADALDELGDLLRLTQEMDKAELALLESHALRETLEPGWSVGGAYWAWNWANLQRDHGRLAEAQASYEIALDAASAVGDEFLEQDVLNDQSWLAYLMGDDGETVRLLEMQRRILDVRSLDAGWVTYHHGWHHLLLRQGSFDRAWGHLADALKTARNASNMYMLVDCLCHDAVRGLYTGDDSLIHSAIDELEQLAAMGCLFDGFRGRARMTLGDFYWEHDRDRAFGEWLAGLAIVTAYGDSGRYEHSIADMIAERGERLVEALRHTPDGDQWRQYWRQAKASNATKRAALELLG
jgi:tetratricopeptide (TPR) repeat protein/CBS domain-containing protein